MWKPDQLPGGVLQPLAVAASTAALPQRAAQQQQGGRQRAAQRAAGVAGGAAGGSGWGADGGAAEAGGDLGMVARDVSPDDLDDNASESGDLELWDEADTVDLADLGPEDLARLDPSALGAEEREALAEALAAETAAQVRRWLG